MHRHINLFAKQVSLDDYRTKRKFDKTPEPEGGEGSGPLRFVVQKHDASHLHYDFRLEMGGILKSWAIPKGPSLNPDDKRLAMMTEDHPYDYRTFEGTIPDGNYGAGTVMVWDEGTYEPYGATGDRDEDDKLARAGVHKQHLTFILHGEKLNGEFALIKMHNAEENAWLLVKADKDEFAGDSDVTTQDKSASTGRSLDEITAGDGTWTRPTDLADVPTGKLPATVKPMLATLADKPFDKPGWLYEIKWDGYRAIATIDNGTVKLRSRNDQDFSQNYPPVTTALEQMKGASAVLDGEIVVVDGDGRSSFGALQDYGDSGGQILYYVFDLLHLDGHDLTKLSLTERKQILRDWLPPSDVIKYSDHVIGRGIEFFKLAEQQNLEGIIAKDGTSKYLPGRRSPSWLKLKTHMRQEAVIGGFTAGRGSRAGFGALILGVYEGDNLRYIGHTGSGFNDRQLTELAARMKPLERQTSLFDSKFKLNEAPTWITPKLICEVEFREWTADGHMRQPIFIGLREDKAAKSVNREQTISAATAQSPEPTTNVKTQSKGKTMAKTSFTDYGGTKKAPIHNSDKVFWPDSKFTKGQLADYYRSVGKTLLPYLKDRPQSLNRFPGGITGHSFFQKNFDETPDWITTEIVHSDGEERDLNYVLCNDIDALMFLINLGAIELNPWNSKVGSLDKPDWCVIDLDPEDIAFSEVIKVAQTVHEVLDQAKIPCYPKTSGATGIHVYIPMGAKYSYDQVKDFAHIVGQLVNAELPKITSLERSPAKRQERVYLDYLQNRRGQTLAAPYCVRPRPGMPVSTPLDWAEVKPGLDPTKFTVNTTLKRLDEVGDLWAPVIGKGIDLKAALAGLG